MKQKTKLQFKTDILKTIGWNVPIGFWFGFVYEQYVRGLFEYAVALEKMKRMRGYTGV